MARNRKGKGHSDPKARRRLILRFFAACPASEIGEFVGVLFEPFNDELDTGSFDSQMALRSAVPLKQQLGFLNLLVVSHPT